MPLATKSFNIMSMKNLNDHSNHILWLSNVLSRCFINGTLNLTWCLLLIRHFYETDQWKLVNLDLNSIWWYHYAFLFCFPFKWFFGFPDATHRAYHCSTSVAASKTFSNFVETLYHCELFISFCCISSEWLV